MYLLQDGSAFTSPPSHHCTKYEYHANIQDWPFYDSHFFYDHSSHHKCNRNRVSL